MLKKFLPILFLFAGFQANAALIELSWDSTISTTSIAGASAGDAVTMTFQFETVTGNLANMVLDADNFLSYGFVIDGGQMATLDLTGGTIASFYINNDFFTFDAGGILASVDNFLITDSSVTSNFGATSGSLFNNGGNCFYCASPNMDLVDPSSGKLASSWAVEVTDVPEPSIIALFAAGLFGIGFARRRRS